MAATIWRRSPDEARMAVHGFFATNIADLGQGCLCALKAIRILLINGPITKPKIIASSLI